MRGTRIFTFGAFRLGASDERLWRGDGAVPLTTKPLAALRYLIDHADRQVPGDEFVAAVWETPHVSEAAVTSYIRDIHRALGDPGQRPQYVETVLGRGYRFSAPVVS